MSLTKASSVMLTTSKSLAKCIKRATNKMMKKYNDNRGEKDHLSDEIKRLIKKREGIKQNPNSSKNRIELNVVCKLLKSKIKEHGKEGNNRIIEKILENSRNTKKMEKQLVLGKDE